MTRDTPIVQLGRRGARIAATDEQLQQAAVVFASNHYVRLSRFFSEELLDIVARDLVDANFVVAEHGEIAREMTLLETRAIDALQFLMNSAPLFNAIARITGALPITQFNGRIYRMIAGGEFFDSWHTDLGTEQQRRLVAISVNVGGDFGGGVLQIRETATEMIVAEVANRQRGDAILFRVHPALQHRLTAIEGSAARTAYAGWFIDATAPIAIGDSVTEAG